MSKSILVTGGAGYIGSEVLKILAGGGPLVPFGRIVSVDWEYPVATRNAAGKSADGVERRCVAVGGPRMSSICREIDFSACIHLADMSDGPSCERITKGACRTSAGSKLGNLYRSLPPEASIVYASSIAAQYGGGNYACMKRYGEKWIEKAATPGRYFDQWLRDRYESRASVIIRLCNVAGNRDRNTSRLIPALRVAADGMGTAMLYGSRQQERDYVHVEDAALALVKAAAISAGGWPDNAPRNLVIGSGKRRSVNHVLSEARRLWGCDIPVERCRERPFDAVSSGATAWDMIMAREHLGWIPEHGLSGILRSVRPAQRSRR